MRRLLVMGLALLLALPTINHAQDAASYGVWVTTQDIISFRQGPGTAFDRIAVVDAAVTLPAIGRTADTRWIQVIYDEQTGWMSSRFLVWSGDVIDLPVDGSAPSAAFVRRAGAVGFTTRETPIYAGEISTQTQVGTLPTGTQIELTGRLGDASFGYFQFQILHEGQLYWIGSWNVRITDGDYRRLLDTQYVFPYGRLVLALEENIALAVTSFRQVESIWQRLDEGQRVECDPIPPRVEQLITVGDAERAPNFIPAVIALTESITQTNAAINRFEDQCANPTRLLVRDDIQAALNEVSTARRNLILVGSLLEPLRGRNPLIEALGN